MNVHQGVMFAILMGAGEHILERSPRYIREKLALCMQSPNSLGVLDHPSTYFYLWWLHKWEGGKDDHTQTIHDA